MTLADRIARAIELLEANGYRVTLLRARGRPEGAGRRIDRETVKRLSSEGMTNADIATELGCAESTVRSILNGTR